MDRFRLSADPSDANMFGKKKAPSVPARETPPVVLRCSFCNKTQHDVKKMIAGPKVQICDECVDLCLDIVNAASGVSTTFVEGRVEPSGRSPYPTTLLLCGLCRMATPLEDSLAVRNRGVICAGCVGEIQAAIAERNPQE